MKIVLFSDHCEAVCTVNKWNRETVYAHSCHHLQYSVIANRWKAGHKKADKDYTEGTIRGMCNRGYPVPLERLLRAGLPKEEYMEPDYNDAHEICVDNKFHISYMMEVGQEVERLDPKLKFDFQCNGRPKDWGKFIWSKAEIKRLYHERGNLKGNLPKPDVEAVFKVFLFDRIGPHYRQQRRHFHPT